MKVIVASFMKNGTTSLNEAFREFGYNSYDWFESYRYNGDVWKKILKFGGSVNDFRRMYKGVDAVVDYPACMFWEQILEAYPDAKVILSMRDEESWFKSAQKQLHSLSDNWWMVFIHLFSYSGWCHFRFCNRVAMLSNASVRAFPWSRCDTSKTVMTNIYRHHNSYILQLLLEHEDEVASDASDPIHEMLEELGEVPDIASLIGANALRSPRKGETGGTELTDEQKTALLNTEISLTLASKVEIKEDDESDIKNLILRTKRMVIDIIRIQVGENLTEVLNTPATDDQEDLHMKNVEKLEMEKKKREDVKEDKDSMLRTRSLLNENKLPLEDMKRRVLRNLKKLQEHGIVTSDDHYQAIVNMIARDIRNQRRYRQRRKQELTKLKQNLERLDQKSKFFEEQSDYYNQYIKSCLASLANKSKKAQKKKKRKVAAIKYTASELHRKKVLLEIEGLETGQFRNVMFEIGQTEDDVGRFEVSAKLLGVNMEKVTLVFQDLLQLQYEGVSVMKMFDGRAKINVNLLIFLLNKKFFGK